MFFTDKVLCIAGARRRKNFPPRCDTINPTPRGESAGDFEFSQKGKVAAAMEYRISESVKNLARVSYASGEGERRPALDCGEGVNTVMPCPAAVRAFQNLDFSLCGDYPHDGSLKDAVAARWRDTAALGRENIILTEGSVGALYLANRLFLEKGSAVLGGASLFFEYGTDVRLHGARFCEVPLDAGERFRVGSFLAAMTPEYRLFYLDNPHNPTGQAIPPDEIEAVAARARDLGACVLFDEAYGDFADDENSAIALCGRYENILVARTFSKAYGLAGLRAGYLVLPGALAKIAANLTNPYAVSALSRRVAGAALGEKDFLPRLRASVADVKRRLFRPWRRLKIAPTCETVSICMITHENGNIDLAEEFARRGVLVVSCSGFAGANSVRLRVPAANEMPRLLAVMEEIDRL